MNTSPDIIGIFLGLGTLQGFFLFIILLFQKKGNRQANLILSLLVLCVTLIIFQNFLVFSGFHKNLPHLILAFFPLNGIIGPLIFFFFYRLIHPFRPFRWYACFHLIPMLILFVRHWSYYFLTAEEKIASINYFYFSEIALSHQGYIALLIKKGILLIYCFSAWYFLVKERADLKKYSSNTTISYIDWLLWVAAIFLLITGISIGGSTYFYLTGQNISQLETFIHLMNTLLIHYVVIIAILKPEKLFFGVITDSRKAEFRVEKRELVTNDELTVFMYTQKPYLNPDLKVHDLASQLHVSPHAISKEINQKMSMNFYDFVNGFRVEEFKNRSVSGRYSHLSLLGIAYDVGFNSKSSFNRIFKRHTGITPSEYINQKKVPTSKVESQGA